METTVADFKVITICRDFSLLRSVQTSSLAHPSTYAMGTWSDFPGVKRPVRESDHTPPSSAEVKNDGGIPLFSIRLHGRVLN
jgi:hypothetical protein